MQLESLIEGTSSSTDRLVSKVTEIGKAYVGIREMLEEDQKYSFSKMYRLMQTKGAKIGLNEQSLLLKEISEDPRAYNFEFVAHVLESPSALSRNVPLIYRNDSRIESSERLVGEYFGEKLALRMHSEVLKNISFN